MKREWTEADIRLAVEHALAIWREQEGEPDPVTAALIEQEVLWELGTLVEH